MPTSLAPRMAPFLFNVIFTQGTVNSLRMIEAISDINFSTRKKLLSSTKEINTSKFYLATNSENKTYENAIIESDFFFSKSERFDTDGKILLLN